MTFSFAVAAALSVIFALSGIAKLRDGRFATDLANYQLLAPTAVVYVAAVLPWVEIATALALLVGPLADVATIVAAGLLAAFTFGVVVNLLRGRSIACGCRGTGHQISWKLAIRNLCLIAAAAVALRSGVRPVVPTLLGAERELNQGGALAILLALGALSVLLPLVSTYTGSERAVRRTRQSYGVIQP